MSPTAIATVGLSRQDRTLPMSSLHYSAPVWCMWQRCYLELLYDDIMPIQMPTLGFWRVVLRNKVCARRELILQIFRLMQHTSGIGPKWVTRSSEHVAIFPQFLWSLFSWSWTWRSASSCVLLPVFATGRYQLWYKGSGRNTFWPTT